MKYAKELVGSVAILWGIGLLLPITLWLTGEIVLVLYSIVSISTPAFLLGIWLLTLEKQYNEMTEGEKKE